LCGTDAWIGRGIEKCPLTDPAGTGSRWRLSGLMLLLKKTAS